MQPIGAGPKLYLTYALRLLILVVLPFSLGFWVLPHVQAMDSSPTNSTSVGSSMQLDTTSLTFVQESGAELGGPQAVAALFPLADYFDFPPFVSHTHLQQCFQDMGSKFVFADGSFVSPSIVWNVSLTNLTEVSLSANSNVCLDAVRSDVIPSNWSTDYGQASRSLGLSRTPFTFSPQTRVYMHVTMDYGLLQGLTLIPVFYLLVWYPLIGIWKKLHKGLMEQ